MMQPSPRRRLATFALAVALGLGCSSSGTGGCAGLTPLAARYSGPKSDNAVNLRISPNGLNYINQPANLGALLSQFAPGGTLSLPIDCSTQAVGSIGTVWVADQGSANGTGRMDKRCDANDLPANVQATINDLQLVPQAPDVLNATVVLTIDTGKIYLSADATLCTIRCSVRFDTRSVNPGRNSLKATVKFSINTRWDKLLAFEITQIDGTAVCGSNPSGTPTSAASCLDARDLRLDSEGGFCSLACDAADWDPIKVTVLRLLSGPLQDQVRAALDGQSCQACGAGLPPCPTVGAATSSCDAGKGVCIDPSTNTCVPRFLGTEGRVALGPLLGGYGVPDSARLDLSLAAGSSVSMDQGINLGTRAGLRAVQVASCVPPLAAPPMVAVTPPDFDREFPEVPADPADTPYHVGLGLSSPFLNLAFHEAQQSGALCLQLSTANVGLLSTGLFRTFLPSLGALATRDGKDAPMMVVLRPARPPQVTVGLGTVDKMTKRPIKPLLTLSLPQLSIDFYAMLDDRFVRLFTLTADISLPIGLIFEGCDKVTPALGDLKSAITNVSTSNSELLAEDPKVLADLIPTVIGLAEPALAGALAPFQLPSLGAFKLKINKAKGVTNVSGTEQYNHLALFATLLPAGASCATLSPTMHLSLKRSVIPAAAQMVATGNGLPLPTAVLAVSTSGAAGVAEYSFRVDGGTWSSFLAPNAQGELEVSHPLFLLQGMHTIEVRARNEAQPHGVSPPASVGFRVDWSPPQVALRADRAADRVSVVASDLVSPDAALLYAYRVGEGSFSPFGAARPVVLSAVEAQGGVTVRVQDEAGNVGEAQLKVALPAERPERAAADPSAPTASSGCSAAGGEGLVALALLALARRRRSALRARR